MIAADRVALVLLAAGRSTRFGAADKLAQDFLGAPLGLHVVTTLAAIGFAQRVAVVSVEGSLDYADKGFRVVVNDEPGHGMARSVRLGVEALGDGWDAVLIALADMPGVTAAQIHRLFAAADGDDAVVASSDGRQPRPPALFGRAYRAALTGLRGDQGARDLIAQGKHIVTSPAELFDVDTPDDLGALRRRVAPG